MNEEYCTCEEGLVRSPFGYVLQRFPKAWHDCTYIAVRNSLIPEAVKRARRRCPQREVQRWALAFQEEMDQLWSEKRRQTPRG